MLLILSYFDLSANKILYTNKILIKLRGKSLLELWVTTDSHPQSLSDLLQNHMSTIHTIRAHAQEVLDESDKD